MNMTSPHEGTVIQEAGTAAIDSMFKKMMDVNRLTPSQADHLLCKLCEGYDSLSAQLRMCDAPVDKKVSKMRMEIVRIAVMV